VIKDELGYFFSSYICEGDGFYPFGKVLSGYDDVFVAIRGRGIYIPNEIKPLSREGPQGCD